jgi:hypothetical protein
VPEELPSPEWIAEAIAFGVLLPCVVSGLVIVLTLPASRNPGPARVVGAVAFACRFLSGYAALCRVFLDKPLIQFEDPWQWLPVWALAAVVVDLFDLPFAKKRIVSGVLRFLAVLAVVIVAAEYLVPYTAARTPSGTRIEEARPNLVQGTRLGLLVLWLGLAWAADRVPGGLFPLLLALPALAGGAVLEASGSGTYAQLAGILAGVLLGCAPLAWWKPDRPFVRGMVPGILVVLCSLMLNGFLDTFVLIPLAAYLLVALAPLSLLIGAVPAVRRLPAFLQSAILAVAILVPLGVAVGLAITAPEEAEETAASAGP